MAEVKAKLNYLRIAPRKVRAVTDLIRGKGVKRAELELKFLTRRSAGEILRLLKSAVANAKHNFQLKEENLFIKNILVNAGPVVKRFRARAFGRAAPIRGRTSHIILILDSTAKVSPKIKKKKSSVEVRDVKADDLKEFVEKKRESQEPEKIRSRPKAAEFVRRVFRRKAI